jgi:hypothetical protein
MATPTVKCPYETVFRTIVTAPSFKKRLSFEVKYVFSLQCNRIQRGPSNADGSILEFPRLMYFSLMQGKIN